MWPIKKWDPPPTPSANFTKILTTLLCQKSNCPKNVCFFHSDKPSKKTFSSRFTHQNLLTSPTIAHKKCEVFLHFFSGFPNISAMIWCKIKTWSRFVLVSLSCYQFANCMYLEHRLFLRIIKKLLLTQDAIKFQVEQFIVFAINNCSKKCKLKNCYHGGVWFRADFHNQCTFSWECVQSFVRLLPVWV